MARRLGRLTAMTAIAAALAVVLEPAGSAAPAHRSATVPPLSSPLSVTYSGAFDMTNTAVPQKTAHSYVYHLEWRYSWSGTWGNLFPDKTRFSSDRVEFPQIEISGTVNATYRERVDGPNLTCSMSIAADRASPPTLFAVYDPSAGTLQVTVEAPTFRGGKLVGVKPQGANCAGGPGVNVFGAPSTFNPLGRGGTVGLNEGGASRYDQEWKWTSSFAGGERRTYAASMRSVVKVGTPATAAATDAAREGLRQAIERAKGPCAHLAISLGVLATGAVWTSVGAAVPGGIPAGGAIIATGDLMASAAAPLCAPLIEDIVVYYSLLVKDPSSTAIAKPRLASCARRQGKARVYCEQLSRALTGLIAAENGLAVAAARLQEAVGALGAARKARNTQGLNTAEATVRSRTAALVAARRATRTAGIRVTSLVGTAGVRGRLTKAQSAATIRALLATLTRRGVPSAKLRALVPAEVLTARPTDFLATLRS